MEGTWILDSDIELLICSMHVSLSASALQIMCDKFSRPLNQFDFGSFLLLGAQSILIYSDMEMDARYTVSYVC